ncbi:hypothetical protein AUC69_00345 [Methyloceanibacter superfactus]|uniref:Uncharacterized protein n=1 Tax=Methyloceanibacter superfactus TaxID=1774969 RepID=A0A1E3W833_9HYPH|nr:hypothetical protein AUC69_00345 [Methyloceanibacter superfactus]
MERARRGDLAVGRLAAAILGDHHVDAMPLQQHAVVRLAEGAPRGEIDGVGHGKRRIDRIDAAHQINMLGRRGEGRYLFSAERKKDAPGRGAQGRDCFGDRIHLDPLIAIRLLPSSTPERDERHAGKRGGADCVGRDLRGVRMGGVNQRADRLVAQ